LESHDVDRCSNQLIANVYESSFIHGLLCRPLTKVVTLLGHILLHSQQKYEKDVITDQWYSAFFVHVPPDVISLQLCTPKVVGA
jgi:hypothetical protein